MKKLILNLGFIGAISSLFAKTEFPKFGDYIKSNTKNLEKEALKKSGSNQQDQDESVNYQDSESQSNELIVRKRVRK